MRRKSSFDLSRFSLRRLKIIYGIALAFIALTLISSSLVMKYVIGQNSDESRVVNLSGRQRMLSQRMTKCVLAIERAGLEADREHRLTELRAAFTSWQSVHAGLQHGDDQLGLPRRENSSEIKRYFNEISPYYNAIVVAVEDLNSAEAKGKLDAERSHQLSDEILSHENMFLTLMDKITFQFDREAKERIFFVGQIEMLILAFGLFVLFLEFVLIFRPSLQHLSEAMISIRTAGDELMEQARELSIAKDQAEAASQSKTAFLASMSHELRTPLNAILGFAEIIRDDPAIATANPRFTEYAGDIYDSGSYLLSLINDILDISKIDAGKLEIEKEHVFIPDIINSIMRMLSIRAVRDGLTISQSISQEATVIEADPRAIKQIVFNLLSNSMKYTRRDGQIDIAITKEFNGLISLVITDTGKGIPENLLPILGTPFEKADNRYSEAMNGTGLGLSLVHGLVALHGGTIAIESALGVGTKVIIRIPQGNIYETGSGFADHHP